MVGERVGCGGVVRGGGRGCDVREGKWEREGGRG